MIILEMTGAGGWMLEVTIVSYHDMTMSLCDILLLLLLYDYTEWIIEDSDSSDSDPSASFTTGSSL